VNPASLQMKPMAHALESFSARATPNADPRDVQKLKKAATEFESILLANWWSAMKQSGLPGSEEDTDPGKDTLDQLGIQAMCTAVANKGGLGISAMLVRSLLSNPARTDGLLNGDQGDA